MRAFARAGTRGSGNHHLPARAAVAMIALAYFANVAFKLVILVWFNRRLAARALWPLAATLGAGGAAFALSGSA